MKTKHQIWITAFAAVSALLTLGIGFGNAAPKNQGGPAFHNDYENALATAKKVNKPVIVIFSASWCPPCQTMKKNVYPSKKVQPFHDDFVWAYLDADQPKNSKIMSAYGSSGIPHIVFLKSDGSGIGQFTGGVSAQQFVDILKQVKDAAGS